MISSRNDRHSRFPSVVWIVSVITLIWMNSSWSRVENRDFQMLSSSEKGCTVAFSAYLFRLDTLTLNGKRYHRASFDMASPWCEKGEPMIPCRVLTVGVPPRGAVRVSVLASDYVEKRSVRLPPVPELKKKDDLPWQEYREGSAYRKSGFIPDVLYEAEAPEYFGDQRVIRIKVYPVQYAPMEDRILYYERIVLKIDFEEAVEIVTPQKRSKNEEFYREFLINYSEARQWRLKPERDLRKGGRTLRMGNWYKIPVYQEQEGVFKVTGSFLESHGVDIGSIQPSTLKIYNNGGRELPRDLTTSRPDSLIENPILLSGMGDERFDESDYFYFYGKGVKGWEYDTTEVQYDHYINHYTDRNIYWLVFNDGNPGQRITSASPPSAQGVQPVSSFWDRFFLEPEITNPLEGGIHWYGPSFDNDKTSESYEITLMDPVPDDSLRFRFRFKGASSSTHRFGVKFNDELIKTVQFSGYSSFDQSGFLIGGGWHGKNTLSFQYTGSGIAPKAYLDWFEVEYRRLLRASEGKLRFFSQVGGGNYDYSMAGFDLEPLVLDVTNPARIRRMEIRPVSDGWGFVDEVTSGRPKNYIAVQESGMLSPEEVTVDEASYLRDSSNGADFIIITHGDFIDETMRLKEMRENYDSLSVFIADIQDVYDEFSWGLFDPTAIRDFVKYAFENWAVRPCYLLLFGDGDYDYRNLLQYTGKNWIPPFEYDGLTESGARASDDWFTYVSGNDSQTDLAVGRIPVQSGEEARVVVDKMIHYEVDPLMGDWKSHVTMVGDDEKAQRGSENEITHIQASEYIAENCIPSLFNFKKIYLTEYPEVITVEGRRKPAVRDDLLEQINRGTILVNYVGHGNEDLWAHEHIFERGRDLNNLHNEEQLSLFYAATCAFALYDNPREQSFSEELLNTEGKGAICVIAASRFCSAAPNEALNKAFMRGLFSNQGPTLRLGDAMRLAKLNVAATINNEMYHIIGDPTMRLGVPAYHARFTKMEPDTFKALSVVAVEGQVEKNGTDWVNFGGKIVLRGFDSKKEVIYTTQYGTKLYYHLPGNDIFRGESQVEGGRFEISFIVPKDISYGQHMGRLCCYFWNDEADGGGYRDGIEVGGSVDLVDTQGPEITLFFTGQENFITGGMVSQDPELAVTIDDDKSGINITGEIGHKIMLIVDGKEKVDVTEYFQYDEGSYLRGRLFYPLSSLEEGEHELILKVWDNANNSSTQSLVFRVVPGGELRIEEVLNYPNPFSSSTHFTFQLNQDAEVEIKVFTVDGRLIRRIDGILGEAGFNMILWDGRDEEGDELANGVYLYKIIGRARVNGRDLKKEVIGRLMVMR